MKQDEVRSSSLREQSPRNDDKGKTLQTSLCSYFSHSPDAVRSNANSRESGESKSVVSLRLFDHKTRRRPLLPTHADTLPAQIQLMLYRSLLSQLLSPSEDFLNSIWMAAGLNAHAKFSAEFIEDIGLKSVFTRDLVSSPREIDSLQSLGEAWLCLAQKHVFNIEDELCIIYLCPTISATVLNEEIEIQIALEASLQESQGSAKNEDSSRAQIRAATEINNVIIGKKTFEFSQSSLDAQINHVMDWWTGERKPLGVEIECVGRCR